MATSAIASLAILKVNWDQLGKDYIENFVPLIAECIRLSDEDVVSLPGLQEDVQTRFGLTLPQSIISSTLSRARKRGYVTLQHHSYRREPAELAKLGFSRIQASVLAGHDSLLATLREFAHSRYALSWSEQQADAALLAFLEDHQLFITRASVRGTVLPDVDPPSPDARYIVAAFAKHLQATGSSHFAFLETVAKGNMLANAVFLPEPSQAQRNFHGTTVFLDTTFLIYALGYAGEIRQAPCLELINLLYETGAELRCFQHTLEEIRGALDACANRIIRGDLRITYGPGVPTFEYFLSRGYSASDLQILISKVDKSLKDLRIRIEQKPAYRQDFLIDEPGLTQRLSERMKYANERALVRDVDTISAIMRLRAGQTYFYVEDSRAVFVTTNTTLAREATLFLRGDDELYGVAPCLTDFSLTNLLWLKRPTSAPTLPRKRIIADCFAATQPDEQLWSKYLAEIDRLEQSKQISAEDYYVLRYSMEAKSSLMDLTRGQEEVFTRATVTEILAHVRDLMTAEVRAELVETQAKRRELQAREDERKARLRSRAQRAASAVIRDVEVIAFLLFALVGVAAFLPFEPPLKGAAWRYFLAGLSLVLAFLSAESFVRGTTLRAILRPVEVRLATRIEWALTTLAG